MPRGTKIGHLGTLDPIASGVLPLAVNKATRIIPFINNEDKEYIAELTFGAVSDTYDATGNITTNNKTVNLDQLKEILDKFKGKIKQLPPMHSAVHYEGKRLYELARKGIQVERPEREVEIYFIDILNINMPTITLRVGCSRGTYIRSLCHDIGQLTGAGAYISSLIRTKSGVFRMENALELEDIFNFNDPVSSYLLPIDYPVQYLTALELKKPQDLLAVKNGNVLYYDEYITSNYVRLYSAIQELVAIAKVELADKISKIKPVRVFI